MILLFKRDANKTYISENKYKKVIISTAMVLLMEKYRFYIDFLIAEIIFFGRISK